MESNSPERCWPFTGAGHCARHQAKRFLCVTSFNLHHNPEDAQGASYCGGGDPAFLPHFLNLRTDVYSLLPFYKVGT